jgi:hypothetical protein
MSFGLAVPRRLIRLNPARRHPKETSHWAAPILSVPFAAIRIVRTHHNVDALRRPGLIQNNGYILRQQALSPGIRQTRFGAYTASQEAL